MKCTVHNRHRSVISAWSQHGVPGGGSNCDMNGGSFFTEASFLLNVIQLVLQLCVCMFRWAPSEQPGWLHPVSCRLSLSGLLPWWSHMRVNNSKVMGLKVLQWVYWQTGGKCSVFFCPVHIFDVCTSGGVRRCNYQLCVLELNVYPFI